MTGSRRSTEPKRPVFGIDRLGVDVLSTGLMRRSPEFERLCPARARGVSKSLTNVRVRCWCSYVTSPWFWTPSHGWHGTCFVTRQEQILLAWLIGEALSEHTSKNKCISVGNGQTADLRCWRHYGNRGIWRLNGLSREEPELSTGRDSVKRGER